MRSLENGRDKNVTASLPSRCRAGLYTWSGDLMERTTLLRPLAIAGSRARVAQRLEKEKKRNPIPFSPNLPGDGQSADSHGSAGRAPTSAAAARSGDLVRSDTTGYSEEARRPPPRWMRHDWLLRCGEAMYSSSAASRSAPPRRRGGSLVWMMAALWSSPAQRTHSSCG